MQAIQEAVIDEVSLLGMEILTRIDGLAAQIAARGAPSGPEARGHVHDAGQQFARDVSTMIDELADRAMSSAAPHWPHSQAAWSLAERDCRHRLALAEQYIHGYVDGGGVVWSLHTDLTGKSFDRPNVTRSLRKSLLFVHERLETAVIEWSTALDAIEPDPQPAQEPALSTLPNTDLVQPELDKDYTFSDEDVDSEVVRSGAMAPRSNVPRHAPVVSDLSDLEDLPELSANPLEPPEAFPDSDFDIVDEPQADFALIEEPEPAPSRGFAALGDAGAFFDPKPKAKPTQDDEDDEDDDGGFALMDDEDTPLEYGDPAVEFEIGEEVEFDLEFDEGEGEHEDVLYDELMGNIPPRPQRSQVPPVAQRPPEPEPERTPFVEAPTEPFVPVKTVQPPASLDELPSLSDLDELPSLSEPEPELPEPEPEPELPEPELPEEEPELPEDDEPAFDDEPDFDDLAFDDDPEFEGEPAFEEPEPDEPEAPHPLQERVDAVLAAARTWDVQVNNLPEELDESWVVVLEERVGSLIDRRKAKVAETKARKERLAALLALAEDLKVRVRKVPNKPSNRWLDRMEAKLAEVRARREGAPSFDEHDQATSDTTAPGFGPKPPDSGDLQRRIDGMVEKSARVGVPLGTIPDQPTELWVTQTEVVVEQFLDKLKAKRKAERLKKKAERDARLARIRTETEELGVDVGPIPPFPTEDWMDRADLRIASTMLKRGVERPADPKAPPASEPEKLPTVLFEEGTVQEKRWVVEDQVTVGRGPDSHVQIIFDAGVSRKHCVIRQVMPGRFEIEDVGSRKGTSLNNARLRAPASLPFGSVIVVGTTRLVFDLRPPE